MEDFVVVEVDQRLRNMLQEIFTDEFMQEHTNFQSFQGFQFSSAVITNWNADQMIYSQHLMDNFVQESTEFDSWDQMVRTATDCRFKKAV